MCIVIDINTFGPIFLASHPDHKDFLPVREWLFNGDGKAVYGGSKYADEVGRVTLARKMLLELQRSGKAVMLHKEEVDAESKVVTELIDNRALDDEHLIAIIRVSKCKLICTLDKRSDKFTASGDSYAVPGDAPKIYRKKAHKHLLAKKYITAVCR